MWIIRTTFLMALMTGLLLAVGYTFGGSSGAMFALIFAFVLNFVSFWYSDKIVLKIYKAREIDESENERLHSMTNRLANSAGIPKPRLFFVDSASPNAFATGRSPKNGVVAVTRGLMENMDPEEVEGVVAHEIAHIKHRDTLISAIAATIAGAISFASRMLFYSALFGGRDRRGNAGGALFMMVVAPLVAVLIQMAISRSREFSADSFAGKITNPRYLARALKKLDMISKKVPMKTDPAMSHLFIVNPLSGGGMMKLFTTHPPVEERIKRLESMAY